MIFNKLYGINNNSKKLRYLHVNSIIKYISHLTTQCWLWYFVIFWKVAWYYKLPEQSWIVMVLCRRQYLHNSLKVEKLYCCLYEEFTPKFHSLLCRKRTLKTPEEKDEHQPSHKTFNLQYVLPEINARVTRA